MKRAKKMKGSEFHRFIEEPLRMAEYASMAHGEIYGKVDRWPKEAVEVPAELRERVDRITHLGLTFAESLRGLADDLSKLSPRSNEGLGIGPK